MQIPNLPQGLYDSSKISAAKAAIVPPDYEIETARQIGNKEWAFFCGVVRQDDGAFNTLEKYGLRGLN